MQKMKRSYSYLTHVSNYVKQPKRNLIYTQRTISTQTQNAASLIMTIGEYPNVPFHGAGCTCPIHRLKSTNTGEKEYAFEFSASQLRFGEGATREVGQDVVTLRGMSARVLVFVDHGVASIPNGPLMTVLDSLRRAGVKNVTIFDEVQVEPTDISIAAAIQVAKSVSPDIYIAVGGGSSMDTAKAANLYETHRNADFLDFVNTPIGKGLPVPGPVRPLIAIPTTAGTGSETTGVSIFDYTPMKAKTGIASRLLKPTLGIVDPKNTITAPPEVAAAAGFDVLCHALESYTAIPFTQRPKPASPAVRPAYQGSNPISDVWSAQALRLLARSFIASVKDRSDYEANADITLAAALAGLGFGNAGVHLCHGMSYAISGLNKTYWHDGYPSPHDKLSTSTSMYTSIKPQSFISKPKTLVPHGISVVLSAPAVFNYTARTSPGRHFHAARLLAGDLNAPAMPACEKAGPWLGEDDAAVEARDGISGKDAGDILSQQLKRYMDILRVPDGLSAIGYTTKDIPALVESTLPQRRVLDLAPRSTFAEDLTHLFASSMKIY